MCDSCFILKTSERDKSDLQEIILTTVNPRSRLYAYHITDKKCETSPEISNKILEIIYYEPFQSDSLFFSKTSSEALHLSSTPVSSRAALLARADQPPVSTPAPTSVILWIKGVIDQQNGRISFYKYLPTNPDVIAESKINLIYDKDQVYPDIFGYKFSNINPITGTFIANGGNYRFVNDVLIFYPQTFTVSFSVRITCQTDTMEEMINPYCEIIISGISLVIGGVNNIPGGENHLQSNRDINTTLRNNNFGKIQFTLRRVYRTRNLIGTMRMNDGYIYNIGSIWDYSINPSTPP